MIPIDETHDAAFTSWVDSQRSGDGFSDPEPAVRTLSPRGRSEVPHRRGHRRPGARSGARGAHRHRRHERAHASRPAGAQGPAASAVAGVAHRQRAAKQRWSRASCHRRDVDDGTALPHRRLHRLLYEHPSRDGGRQAIPSGQSAAAQLPVGADRLSRTRIVNRRERQAIRRPAGQFKGADDATPGFGPTRRLDYELELGAFIALPNDQGEPVPISDAEAHLFGLALFNDWTARDIQAWEYQPLGPFLSKNFASTLSPWIVTLEALAPFRVPFARPAG